MPRPPTPTTAPRPACRYYNTPPRGCFAGERCRFRHADPTYTPHEANKTCRFFARGFCKRGAECWFAHAAPPAAPAAPPECGICFEERPALYGLLSGCSHAFCLDCIRRWRDPAGKGAALQESATHKTCPMCRALTAFITPSSLYYAQDDARKHAAVAQYKASMARVPCRYFARSPPARRFCPFGRDCFYAHRAADGAPHAFAGGVDAMMPQWRARQAEQGAPPPPDEARAGRGLRGERGESAAGRAGERGREDTRGGEPAARDVLDAEPAAPEPAAPEPAAGSDPAEAEAAAAPDPAEAEAAVAPEPAESDAARERAPEPVATERAPDSSEHAAEHADAAPSAHAADTDPRSPANAARDGALVRGDFAWMMGCGE